MRGIVSRRWNKRERKKEKEKEGKEMEGKREKEKGTRDLSPCRPIMSPTIDQCCSFVVQEDI